jgi:hypothetical protein
MNMILAFLLIVFLLLSFRHCCPYGSAAHEKRIPKLTSSFKRIRSSFEHFTPAKVPYLSTTTGAPSELKADQTLTDNGKYGFAFEVTDSGSSRMYVRDLETNVDVWAATLPGTIDKVQLKDSLMVAVDTTGQVLWSSPAPTGPNAGAPYYLRVTESGSLNLLDGRNGRVFSTPNAVALVHPMETVTAMQVKPTATATVKSSSSATLTGPTFMIPDGPYGLPRIFGSE